MVPHNPGIAVWRRTITSGVMQKDNAEIIREELHSLSGKHGTFGNEPAIPDTPCPFLASVLGMSWDIDLDSGYSSGGTITNSLLPAGMCSWDGDNNDGISIIDVTDLENPAYCFATEAEPLTATEYLSGYYSIPGELNNGNIDVDEDNVEPRSDENDKKVRAAIGILDGVRLIDLSALHEAWPTEYRPVNTESTAPAEPSDAGNPPVTIPSLVNFSLPQAILQTIEGGDTTIIEQLLWLPGKRKDVRDVLQAQKPYPDEGLPLLAKTLKELSDTPLSVDLSGFDLADAQVIALAQGLESVEALNLSRIARITIDGVREVLTLLSSGLKRIVLMNCESIADEDIWELLRTKPSLFYKLEALMHPALLQITQNPSRTPAITFLTLPNDSYRGVSLPIFTPAGVIQGLTDFIASMVLINPWQFDATGGAIITAACTASPRKPGQSWNERNIVTAPSLSFDTLSNDIGGWIFIVRCAAFPFGGPNGWALLRFPPRPSKAKRISEGKPQKKTSESKGSSGEAGEVEGASGNTENRDLAENDSSDKETDPGDSNETVTHSGLNFELHDIRSFLAITTQEGRPAVPEEAVLCLEELLRRLEDNPTRSPPGKRLMCPKFTRDQVEKCLLDMQSQAWQY
ncbi:hypothetical protein EW026_g3611 [Hermanssonia centrifuga]|uniref:Uncharacterized protein n=1 Tax=Hermanssonia centrifuga TaxID=98765 RepID=A0A4S4KKT6_9APHY|nr:hypothetical protein EW026_g3611 [Hermanssonia centrifuga]